MILFAFAAVAAAVLCGEMLRWTWRCDKPGALLAVPLVALAIAGAWWCCGGLVK
ncbi:MAG: hypothetical protein LC130_03975 [Bryobacterales bacterium]|nr:hypothetical protein [Bryobacterales bacterium]